MLDHFRYLGNPGMSSNQSTLTKKLVQLKYKMHIGRELKDVEKSRINGMVSPFIRETVAEKRNSDSRSPQSEKSTSPSGEEKRENKQQKIILKDSVDFPHSDHVEVSSRKEGEGTERSGPSEEPKFNLQEAVIKRSKGLEQKIQLSKEKQQKFAKKGVSRNGTVRRSLHDNLVDPQTQEDGSISSSLVIVFSEDDATAKTAVNKNKKSRKRPISDSDSGCEMDDPLAKKKVLFTELDCKMTSSETELSDEETKDRKKLLSYSKSSTLDTPLVKRKTKRNLKKSSRPKRNVDSESSTGDTPLINKRTKEKASSKIIETDSDTESSTGDTPLINKRTKEKASSKIIETDSDTESSTGDTPLIKKRSKVKTLIIETDSFTESGLRKTPLLKRKKKVETTLKIETNNDLDSSTKDTPLTKKRNKVKTLIIVTDSDTESDLRKTPLLKKKKKVKKPLKIETNNDLDSSTGDTPLAKKRGRPKAANLNKQAKSVSDSDVSSRNTPLKKRSSVKLNRVDEDSGSDISSGVTPLAKKSKAWNNICKTGDNGTKLRCDISVKPNSKADNASDGESSTGKSPLAKKKKTLKASAKGEDGLDSDSGPEVSAGNTPVLRKWEKFSPLKKIQDIFKTDSDVSTGNSSLDGEKRNSGQRKHSESPESNKNALKAGKTNEDLIILVDSSSSESEMSPVKTPVKSTTKTSKQKGSGKQVDSVNESDFDDSINDIPLAQLKKSSTVVIATSDEESRVDTPVKLLRSDKRETAMSEVDTSVKETVMKLATEEESSHLKQLRKICQACGISIRNDRELKGCNTDQQKVNRLEEFLKEFGMEGRPSLKKAEQIRLLQEATELNEGNIISAVKGRGKRKVRSLYSQQKPSPKKSPSPRKWMKKVFGDLKVITDSEGSDED